jgi:hypothetical protein
MDSNRFSSRFALWPTAGRNCAALECFSGSVGELGDLFLSFSPAVPAFAQELQTFAHQQRNPQEFLVGDGILLDILQKQCRIQFRGPIMAFALVDGKFGPNSLTQDK